MSLSVTQSTAYARLYLNKNRQNKHSRDRCGMGVNRMVTCLMCIWYIEAERDVTGLELGQLKTANAFPIKVVEAASKVAQLGLAHVVRLSGHELDLHLVDCSLHVGQELLPTDTQGVHCVVGLVHRVDSIGLQLL